MTVETVFELVAVFVALAAAFGYINHRWFKLPHTIGILVIALATSVAILIAEALFPILGFGNLVRSALLNIEFEETLMKGLLSFLLFAGALHVDLESLLERRWVIATLATVGICLSTVLVAFFMFYGLSAMNLNVPWSYCLVLGALISPTDPVAVMGVLKHVRVPQALETKIAGESLFNDGVGVVLYTVLLAVAVGDPGHGSLGLIGAVRLLITEAVGGFGLGLLAGYGAFRCMKTIDEHKLEILITLGLVMGTYAVASDLHVSGPLAVVVAGLFIGNYGKRFAMSVATREHLDTFWSLIDEILNSLLFLAIGFEIIAITISRPMFGAALFAVPVVLLARWISVAGPIKLIGLRQEFTEGSIQVLTWGGLRGGISVALALALPSSPWKPTLLAITYGVVLFSIIVQGLTIERVVKKVCRRHTEE